MFSNELHAPSSYEEWVNLSDEQQDRIHHEVWNVNRRDGVPFAFLAAARLALQSKLKVLDVTIGTYHGNELVLQLCVSDDDYGEAPAMFSQRFEGFRVIWMSHSMWVQRGRE